MVITRPPRRRLLRGLACILCLSCASFAFEAFGGQAPAGEAARRAGDRLRALEREAADLATREKTLLAELRKLELERQIRAEELAAIERDLADTEAQLAAADERAASLGESAARSMPEVEQRLVRLYKMGRAGYWRLLLDVDDARAVGRAYRTAAALTTLDRESIRRHEATVRALNEERAALASRRQEIEALQQRAAAARASADRAVASRAALLQTIAARRDLTAQLASELRTAQDRLDSALASGRPVAATLPLRPFKGDVPWPADGIVTRRFGRDRTASGGIVARNGIELSLAEGRPVAAVHEGVVTYAAPFAGYGNLVIVEHGGSGHSLYGHLAAVSVNKGDRVEPGTRVGLAGRNLAGNPALYFELRIDGRPVDPLQWLRRQP
ncbi:MAG TPA: peptidoglycan DD-metalloendopeptidase family protein [Vicinamibacterales bacterium]|nr:peptidoglycan DD-metalloendopeptidase family protein [Vicinamibacterales bacterium]